MQNEEEIPSHYVYPEQNFWIAFVRRGIVDLFSPIPEIRQDAQAWFDADSDEPGGFNYAIDLSNLSKPAVLQMADKARELAALNCFSLEDTLGAA